MRSIVGAAHVLVQPSDVDAYLHDWRNRHHGRCVCVVRPGATTEVAAALAFATEHAVPVFTQGGNTSVCGGSVPSEAGDGIVLSLSRMNAVLEVNPSNNSITV